MSNQFLSRVDFLKSSVLTVSSKPWLAAASSIKGTVTAGDNVVIVDTVDSFLTAITAKTPNTFLANLEALHNKVTDTGSVQLVFSQGMPASKPVGTAQAILAADVQNLANNADGAVINLTANQFKLLSSALDSSDFLKSSPIFANQSFAIVDTAANIKTAFGATTYAQQLASAAEIVANTMQVRTGEGSVLLADTSDPISISIVDTAGFTVVNKVKTFTQKTFDNSLLVEEISSELGAYDGALSNISVNTSVSFTHLDFNLLSNSDIAFIAENYSKVVVSGSYVKVDTIVALSNEGIEVVNQQATPIGLGVKIDTLIEQNGIVTVNFGASFAQNILDATEGLNNSAVKTPITILATDSLTEFSKSIGKKPTILSLTAEDALAVVEAKLVIPKITGANFKTQLLITAENLEQDLFGNLDHIDSLNGLSRSEGLETLFKNIADAQVNEIKLESAAVLHLNAKEAESLSLAKVKLLDASVANNAEDVSRDVVIELADANEDGVVRFNGSSDNNNFANNKLTVAELVKLVALQKDTGGVDATDISVKAETGVTMEITLAEVLAFTKSASGAVVQGVGGAAKVSDFIHLDADSFRVSMTSAELSKLTTKVVSSIQTVTNAADLEISISNKTANGAIQLKADLLTKLVADKISLLDKDGHDFDNAVIEVVKTAGFTMNNFNQKLQDLALTSFKNADQSNLLDLIQNNTFKFQGKAFTSSLVISDQDQQVLAMNARPSKLVVQFGDDNKDIIDEAISADAEYLRLKAISDELAIAASADLVALQSEEAVLLQQVSEDTIALADASEAYADSIVAASMATELAEAASEKIANLDSVTLDSDLSDIVASLADNLRDAQDIASTTEDESALRDDQAVALETALTSYLVADASADTAENTLADLAAQKDSADIAVTTVSDAHAVLVSLDSSNSVSVSAEVVDVIAALNVAEDIASSSIDNEDTLRAEQATALQNALDSYLLADASADAAEALELQESVAQEAVGIASEANAALDALGSSDSTSVEAAVLNVIDALNAAEDIASSLTDNEDTLRAEQATALQSALDSYLLADASADAAEALELQESVAQEAVLTASEANAALDALGSSDSTSVEAAVLNVIDALNAAEDIASSLTDNEDTLRAEQATALQSALDSYLLADASADAAEALELQESVAQEAVGIASEANAALDALGSSDSTSVEVAVLNVIDALNAAEDIASTESDDEDALRAAQATTLQEALTSYLSADAEADRVEALELQESVAQEAVGIASEANAALDALGSSDSTSVEAAVLNVIDALNAAEDIASSLTDNEDTLRAEQATALQSALDSYLLADASADAAEALELQESVAQEAVLTASEANAALDALGSSDSTSVEAAVLNVIDALNAAEDIASSLTDNEDTLRAEQATALQSALDSYLLADASADAAEALELQESVAQEAVLTASEANAALDALGSSDSTSVEAAVLNVIDALNAAEDIASSLTDNEDTLRAEQATALQSALDSYLLADASADAAEALELQESVAQEAVLTASEANAALDALGSSDSTSVEAAVLNVIDALNAAEDIASTESDDEDALRAAQATTLQEALASYLSADALADGDPSSSDLVADRLAAYTSLSLLIDAALDSLSSDANILSSDVASQVSTAIELRASADEDFATVITLMSEAEDSLVADAGILSSDVASEVSTAIELRASADEDFATVVTLMSEAEDSLVADAGVLSSDVASEVSTAIELRASADEDFATVVTLMSEAEDSLVADAGVLSSDVASEVSTAIELRASADEDFATVVTLVSEAEDSLVADAGVLSSDVASEVSTAIELRASADEDFATVVTLMSEAEDSLVADAGVLSSDVASEVSTAIELRASANEDFATVVTLMSEAEDSLVADAGVLSSDVASEVSTATELRASANEDFATVVTLISEAEHSLIVDASTLSEDVGQAAIDATALRQDADDARETVVTLLESAATDLSTDSIVLIADKNEAGLDKEVAQTALSESVHLYDEKVEEVNAAITADNDYLLAKSNTDQAEIKSLEVTDEQLAQLLKDAESTSTLEKMDVISGFTKGTDVIDLLTHDKQDAGSPISFTLKDEVTIGIDDDIQEALKTAFAGTAENGAAMVVVNHGDQKETYLFVNDANEEVDANRDVFIQLLGVDTNALTNDTHQFFA